MKMFYVDFTKTYKLTQQHSIEIKTELRTIGGKDYQKFKNK